MTVITKPISDKKPDKTETLLNNVEALGVSQPNADVESSVTDDAQFVILRARARRVSTATTLCLFLTALMVMSIGIIGGVYLYRQYARAQMHRFRGWCNIPYDGTKATMYLSDPSPYKQDEQGSDMLSDSGIFDSLNHLSENEYRVTKQLNKFFKEEFELDLDNENYEKIDVPDFQGGRRGRFIHDFNSNKTGIIDIDNHRCFVMPLNRGVVLPPRSLFDLIHKMWEGYYNIDTELVRETMRVVTPPIKDFSDMGTYIKRECEDMPTYKLEKYVSSVFKRSVDLTDGAKFAQFSGKKLLELDIINLAEVEDYEQKHI